MDSRVVQIAEQGVFSGKATMDVAEIWGSFEGQLTVRQQLVIYGTGRVSGQVRYGKIRIEEGGELTGDVSTLSTAPTKPRTIETPEAPEPPAKPISYEPLQRPARQGAKSGATAS
jgi:cytoskeletal protein CcmA (bactofilin family)